MCFKEFQKESFEDDLDIYLCKRKKNILFEQGDFESEVYLATVNTYHQICFTQKTRNLIKMFTGIGIMNSSVKNSAFTEKCLILY